MPTIVAAGSQSMSVDNVLEFTAVDCPTHRMGAMIWNTHPTSLPFGSGTLCIPRGLGAQLVPPSPTGSTGPGPCSGTLSTALTGQQLMNNGAFAGSTVHAQFVFRTPRAIGSRLVLSNAIAAEIAP